MMVIIVLILCGACVVYAVAAGNRFKQLRIKIQEAQADIEVALIKRYDVLMQSLDAIKGYMEHEEKLMLSLIQARNGMTCHGAADGNEEAVWQLWRGGER